MAILDSMIESRHKGRLLKVPKKFHKTKRCVIDGTLYQLESPEEIRQRIQETTNTIGD